MAPIKFEENIREKLEQRSLQPSAQAWNNLEQKLNLENKKRSSNKYWWFGIAASVIGVIFVFQQFVSFNNMNQGESPTIVDSENEKVTDELKAPFNITESQEVAEEDHQDTPIEVEITKKPINEANFKKTKRNEMSLQLASIATKKKEESSIIEPENNSKDDLNIPLVNLNDTTLNAIVDVQEVNTKDSEIEDLLKTATKDIQLSEENSIKTVAVDANSLLEDVETEMPPSLRGQLFKVIEKNFKTAKTAVATRNK